jgi:hypothetical protein
VIARALQIPEKTHSQTRELEDAVTLLEPFATVTDVLQGNKATLFDTLLCMEALTKHFQDLMGKQPNTAYGSAMKRNIEAVTGALLARMRMLLGRAYLVLAYFAPSTDYDDPNQSTWLARVKGLLSSSCYGIPTSEWEKWSNLVLDVNPEPVTFESYKAHIEERVKPHCPQIAKTVLDLLRSCPSEAPVERLFSKLKYSFDQWRCNATVDLVNAVLRTQSGFAYFHPVLELPDVVVAAGSKDKDPTPAKAARAEGQTTATPAREQPTATAVGTPQQQIVPQPPRTAAAAPPAAPAEVNQVIDDDDEEPGFRIPNSVEYVFGYVLDLLSSEVAAPPLPNTGGTKSTRSVADKCSKCHAPCKRHEYAAYIVCKLCPRDRHDYYPAKISVSHIKRVCDTIAEAQKNEHVEIKGPVWECPQCLATKRK